MAKDKNATNDEKKTVLEEFKEFAMEGNMIDLAVGIIIGGAVGKVVASLVSDIIMPPIGMLLGKVNFSDLYIALDRKDYDTMADAIEAGAPTLNYGLFLTSLIDFLIIAFVIFIIVKQVNKLRK